MEKRWKFFTIILVSFSLGINGYSNEPEGHGSINEESEQGIHEVVPEIEVPEKFEAGSFIFDHISDSHEWHFVTLNHKHVSIPLPVILYSKETGLTVFMSKKFHHGHELVEKNGYSFKLHTEGEYKEKIEQISPTGESSFPLDFSITKNVASLLFSIGIMLWIFLSIAKKYKRNPNSPPKGLQSLLEPIILFIRDEVAIPSIGHKYERYMPFLLTLFFFIWFNNMLGLVPIIPGGANLSGNIAVTMVLALFTFVITTVSGTKGYWKHMVNTPGVPWWLKLPVPLLPFVEVIGIFTKPFVLMIRLFANITAGHIIGLGFVSLIFIFGQMNQYLGYGVAPLTLVFMVFMTFLELLVAFIQAYVFTFLSALYFGMALEDSH